MKTVIAEVVQGLFDVEVTVTGVVTSEVNLPSAFEEPTHTLSGDYTVDISLLVAISPTVTLTAAIELGSGELRYLLMENGGLLLLESMGAIIL